MSESHKEQISRLRLMAAGDATWDLSDNDRAAIGMALQCTIVADPRRHIIRDLGREVADERAKRIDAEENLERSKKAFARLQCSFCGKPRREVSRLVAGANAVICDECIVVTFAMMIGSRVRFASKDPEEDQHAKAEEPHDFETHDFSGDGHDCGVCGEGRAHYVHRPRSPDTMPCWSCDQPVGGEWFDGEDLACDNCGEEGVATAMGDGTWLFVKVDDVGEAP